MNFAEGQTLKDFRDKVHSSAAQLQQHLAPTTSTNKESPNVSPSKKEEKKGGFGGFISGLFGKNKRNSSNQETQPEEPKQPEFKISVKKGTFERKSHIGLNKETGKMEVVGMNNLPQEFQSMLDGFTGIKLDLSNKEEQEALVDTILAFEAMNNPQPEPEVVETKLPPPPPTKLPVTRPPPPPPKTGGGPPPPVIVTGGGPPPPPPPPPPPNFNTAPKAPAPPKATGNASPAKNIAPANSRRDDLLSAIRSANPQELLKRVDPSKMDEQQKSNFESLLMQRMNKIREDVEPESDEDHEDEWSD
jgi:outer membrane biosynthesis protein TonB